jgi:hypothetical protein
MSDPFASALDAIFNAPGSEAAEHISIFGQVTPDIRIIRSRPDQMVRFGDGQIVTASNVIEIRKSEVPSPAHDDRLILRQYNDAGDLTGELEFALTGEPVSDVEGMTWTCGAEPVDVSR